MKLNIQRFAGDAWVLNAIFSNYKYNTTGRLIQVTLKITSNYNIGSVYDIDSKDNENWAYSLWNVHDGVGTYPYSEAPYIERTFYNLNDLKGVKITTYETSSTQNKTITYNFEMDVSGEEEKTTYLTKTSATAVLKGNVLNSLNTYDYNNAPSVGAVRNYLESGSLVHQNDVDGIISQAVSNALLAAHPVGSIEINITGTNPSEYLGGTWESFGAGRVLMGVGTGIDSNNTSQTFSSAEKTGGEYTHKLTIDEMPSHRHRLASDAALIQTGGDFYYDGQYRRSQGKPYTDYTGGGQAHNNIQPYITAYFWKRIN